MAIQNSISTYICFYFFSIHLHFFIPLCQSRLMPISFCLVVNPNSRQYLSNPFSLPQSNPHLSTCIYFYLFSIHDCIFLYLVYINLHISLSIPFPQSQSITCILTYSFFYLFADLNSRLYLSTPLSSSQSILRISTCYCFYLFSIHLNFFIPLFKSKFTTISSYSIFFISD